MAPESCKTDLLLVATLLFRLIVLVVVVVVVAHIAIAASFVRVYILVIVIIIVIVTSALIPRVQAHFQSFRFDTRELNDSTSSEHRLVVFVRVLFNFRILVIIISFSPDRLLLLWFPFAPSLGCGGCSSLRVYITSSSLLSRLK